MFASTIYNGTDASISTPEASLTTKNSVIGLCTVECTDAGTNLPKVIIQGKFNRSTDLDVDSGWVDIVTFTDIDVDSVVGKGIGIFTYMRAVISNNSDNKRITVTIGYN